MIPLAKISFLLDCKVQSNIWKRQRISMWTFCLSVNSIHCHLHFAGSEINGMAFFWIIVSSLVFWASNSFLPWYCLHEGEKLLNCNLASWLLELLQEWHPIFVEDIAGLEERKAWDVMATNLLCCFMNHDHHYVLSSSIVSLLIKLSKPSKIASVVCERSKNKRDTCLQVRTDKYWLKLIQMQYLLEDGNGVIEWKNSPSEFSERVFHKELLFHFH